MEAAIRKSDPPSDVSRLPFAATRHQDLEQVFSQFLDPVYRFFYARVGNREDAEDLTSQVFVKASRQLDTSHNEPSVARWLFTVARTVLADHWRQYYRVPRQLQLSEETVAEKWFDESTSQPSPVTAQMVEQLLRTLPARYRAVLELRFLQGYSVNEAARQMNVTPGNLKVLQHRALARAAELGLPSVESHGEQPSPRSTPGDAADVREQNRSAIGVHHRVHERDL